MLLWLKGSQMKQKIAILGAGGMLGSMVLDVFAKDENFSIIATVRDLKEAKKFKKYKGVIFQLLDVEYADTNTFKKALGGAKWVINCIGIIKPYIHDDNAPEVERAVRINALFPHTLAKSAKEINAKVIQIATDCVYSGSKGNYKEGDLHDPLDVYGKTKSLGEVYFGNFYNLRCSIIGPEISGHFSLLDWFLTQPKGAKLNGYKNHFWNGVTTLHFAKLCLGIINKNISIGHLQHFIPADKNSKADMLKIFAKEFDRSDVKITSVGTPVLTDRTLATNFKGRNRQLWKSAGYNKIPTISEMIAELAKYKFLGEK